MNEQEPKIFGPETIIEKPEASPAEHPEINSLEQLRGFLKLMEERVNEDADDVRRDTMAEFNSILETNTNDPTEAHLPPAELAEYVREFGPNPKGKLGKLLGKVDQLVTSTQKQMADEVTI